MTTETQISQEHLDAARDAVLGLDPRQAPTDPETLNERLSIAQPELTNSIQLLFKAAKAKHLSKATPLVYTLVEAANRAYPDRMKSGLRSKAFVTSIAAISSEARGVIADGGKSPSPTRDRQPVLASFLDHALLGEDALPATMTQDERTGLVALALGTLRTIDRQLAGVEQPITVAQGPGRNDPCPCGSGKKFKKCHGGPGAAA